MVANKLSEEERRKLRQAHASIYLFPILAGLLTISLGVTADVVGMAQDQFVVIGAFVVNTFLAGVASAYVVTRQHPQEQGKWWRAGTSFLFALPLTFMATVFFAMCLGCAGIIR